MNPAGNRDARFADPAWQRSPLYRRLGQAYLTAEQAITALAGRAGPDWRTRERARLAASLLTSALAPTNTLPGNPAALRHAVDTGGHSLLRGARNLLADVRAGRRVPGQADTRRFRLGGNLGATPGAVVFRNDVLELIQYSPATPQVHTVPLLMVWSLINRYYILDLAPGRSFIEYAAGQGIGVFATSWRNPGREHAGWDLDRYAAALAEAMDALARLATRVTGLVDGRDIAAGFAWLRPGELVWGPWVNNYLLGQDPPAHDILAWNADSTRLPGAAARQLLAMAEHNQLATPGGLRLLGTPVDLSRVTVPGYVIGAETDHLVPWPAAYAATRLLGGETSFVLSGGGHVQHLVNPPGNPKARYRTGPPPGGEPAGWRDAATVHRGSWWGHWADWVRARSGAPRPAPVTLGSPRFPPLEPAPGRYVREP